MKIEFASIDSLDVKAENSAEALILETFVLGVNSALVETFEEGSIRITKDYIPSLRNECGQAITRVRNKHIRDQANEVLSFLEQVFGALGPDLYQHLERSLVASRMHDVRNLLMQMGVDAEEDKEIVKKLLKVTE